MMIPSIPFMQLTLEGRRLVDGDAATPMLIVVRRIWIIDHCALRCESPQVLLSARSSCPVLLDVEAACYGAAAAAVWPARRGRIAVARHCVSWSTAGCCTPEEQDKARLGVVWRHTAEESTDATGFSAQLQHKGLPIRHDVQDAR